MKQILNFGIVYLLSFKIQLIKNWHCPIIYLNPLGEIKLIDF